MTSKSQLLILLVLSLVVLLATGVSHAQITPLQDAYTNSADPTTNYGSNVLLSVDGATEVRLYPVQSVLDSIGRTCQPGGFFATKACTSILHSK